MRIWDLPPHQLCRNHLLGEHREIHAVWSILTQAKDGYAHHPEVMRWRDRLGALYLRHEAVREDMERRGFVHQSPLDRRLATGRTVQDRYVVSIREQRRVLGTKGCDCRVARPPRAASRPSDPAK